MPDTPVITVVVPTRDRKRLLARALESVSQQTFRDFETIVVDDGSAVPVEETCEELDLPGMQLLRHKSAKGAGAARNDGIERFQALSPCMLYHFVGIAGDKRIEIFRR